MMRRLLTMLVVLLMALPCLGADDGRLTTSSLSVRTINLTTDGTFTRAGTAYLGSDSAMTAYGTDVRRTLRVNSISQPASTDGIAETLLAGNASVPWCKAGGYLYAVSRAASTELWRSTDGSTWAKSKTFGGTIYSVHTVTNSAGTDRVLAWVGTAAVNMKPQYSDDGATFTECTCDVWEGAPFFSSVFQSDSGIICAGTYIGVTTTNHIMRSVDYGVTWTEELEVADSGINHFHAIIKHEATGKWLADTGDTDAAKQRTYVSANDGDTWSLWNETKSSPSRQVTRYLDLGHATRIYYGSDGVHRFGFMDLEDWSVGTLVRTQPYLPGYFYWDVAKVGSLYYAGVECNLATGARNAAIYVSPDLVEWIPYYICDDNDVKSFSHFAGVDSTGKLHWIALSGAGGTTQEHLVVSPAQVRACSGLYLQPAKTNAATSTISTCDDVTGWTDSEGAAPDIFSLDSTVQFLPVSLTGGSQVGCIKVYSTGRTDEDDCYVNTPAISTTAEHTYVAHAWIKGKVKRACVQIQGQSKYEFALREEDKWTEWWTPPYTTPAATADRKVSIYGYPDADGTVEFWVGAVELIEIPFLGEWSEGGGAQATDAFSYEHTPSSDWTHFFTVEWQSGSYTHGAATDSYVCSWILKSDDNEYAELYWDASEYKWTLATTDNGGAGATAATAARLSTAVQRRHPVRFAVRNSGGSMRLSVMDGQNVEHVAAAAKSSPYLYGGALTIRSGKSDGTAMLDHVLSNIAIYDSALSDDEVETIMESGAWSRKAGGTTRLEWGR